MRRTTRSTCGFRNCGRSCLQDCRERLFYRNYKDLNYTDGEITGDDVAGILLEELRDDSPLKADNKPRQQVVRRK